MDIGLLIWSSIRPILRVTIIMFFGFLLSRTKNLSKEGSKNISNVLLHVLYPTLLFSTLILSINEKNVSKLGLLTAVAMFYVGLGWILGHLIRLWFKPPKHFRNGCVMAASAGNFGDLTLAVVMSLGKTPPFDSGDAQTGVAYVTAFLCSVNLYLFSYGHKQFAQDMKEFRREAELEVHSQSTNSSSCPGTANTTQADINPNFNVDLEKNNKNSTFGKSETIFKSSTLAVWTTKIIRKAKNNGVFHSIFNLCNLSVLAGLVFALVPALRDIFIPQSFLLNGSKPPINQEAPLFFLYEIFEFIGRAAVPIGLLNLGSALGRLSFKSANSLKLPLAIATARLIIIPIIGILLTQLLTFHTPLLPPEDKMLRFVIMFQGCVPTASSTVFLTQFWHPKGETNEISSVILVQYVSIFLTLTVSTCIILYLLQ